MRILRMLKIFRFVASNLEAQNQDSAFFMSPPGSAQTRNLRNPPSQSLRPDRFCVIYGYFYFFAIFVLFCGY